MNQPDSKASLSTRDQIIQVAYPLFVQNGYHGTSMRQIAQGVGMALGGIYNHFASKEEIFISVFVELHPYHEVLTLIAQAQGDTIEAVLHNVVQNLNDNLVDEPEKFLKLMFIELVEFNARHMQQLFEEIFPSLVEMSQRLFVEPDRLRNLPPAVVVRAFLGMFFSYFMTEWLFARQLPIAARENALDTFLDIYLHGILEPGTSKEAA